MQTILFAHQLQHMSTLLDVVVADRNLASMLKTVKAAGLENDLNKKGPFTVFAPTDLAFGKLEAGKLAELLMPENKKQLAGILSHHMVEGRNNFRDLKDGQKLTTLSGKELDVKITGGFITINGAKLQGSDGEAANGVIHSVDAVLS